MISTRPSLCVYCGSREGARPAYMAEAVKLGAAMAANGWRLVYGAGDIGIMGAIANAAQNAGGKTFGVIPTHLLEWEAGKRDLTQFIVTENMHERKKIMYMNSDAIAVLPGGAGTLDEFFEVLTWRQLGLHRKPIYLIDTDGYWQPLVAMVDHVIAQGFADASLRDFITVLPDATALIAELERIFAPQ
ncbi:MAG: TIGR00730 family Rossman fold protein [Paracoccaceae bacterium]